VLRPAVLTPLGISAPAAARLRVAVLLAPVSAAARAASWQPELLLPPVLPPLQRRLAAQFPWPRPEGASPCQAQPS